MNQIQNPILPEPASEDIRVFLRVLDYASGRLDPDDVGGGLTLTVPITFTVQELAAVAKINALINGGELDAASIGCVLQNLTKHLWDELGEAERDAEREIRKSGCR